MGSLKSKKKIHVASTVYNLAGPEDARNNFLKNTVLAIVTSPRDLYIGENLTRSYLNGPGITMRTFSRWAKTSGYTEDVVKQGAGSLTFPASVNHTIIANYISPNNPESIRISLAEIGIVEYNYWAMQYILEEEPELVESNWVTSFDEIENRVIIHFQDDEGETTSTVSFTPAGYTQGARYIYATYTRHIGEKIGDIEEGVTYIHDTDPVPSTVGWTQISQEIYTTLYEIPTTIHTLVEYSDGTPSTESTDSIPKTVNETDSKSVWEKFTYLGSMEDVDGIGELKEILYLNFEHRVKEEVTQTVSVETISEGVTKTTTVTTTTRSTESHNTSRIDEQVIVTNAWEPAKMLIYREGSGSVAMDSQFEEPVFMGDYFPFIPVRLWNKFVSESYEPELYTTGKKAFKKSTGGKLDGVIDSLADNPSLKDIDHAFVTFGVSLNAKDKSSRRYIYEFFKNILDNYTGYDYEVWEESFQEATAKQAIWREWRQAQGDPLDPLFDTPEPEYVDIPYAPAMSVRIRSTHPSIDYDMTLSWSSMTESGHIGVFKEGARVGDIDISNGDKTQDDLLIYVSYGNNQELPVDWRDPVVLTWQHEANHYRRLTVRGLNHRNIVYKGKSVTISGRSAINDTEESGFIVPLHSELFRAMPLVHSTQMSQASSYMVLNSWQETKQKWYQSGAFKIILVVAVIIVSVVAPPVGAGGAGVLGTNAAVGAKLGFAGIAATVAGAVANAIAAIVIAQVLTAGATALFGEKWGTIIGTIASLVVINMGTNAATGSGWSIDYNQLTKADNLLKLTAGIGKGIAHDIQMKAMKKFEETEALIADYEEQSKRIAELYTKNIGDGQGIDLIAIQEIASRFDFNYEAPTDFLTRTLMTGTDIAELSQSLIDDFASITTSLDLS